MLAAQYRAKRKRSALQFKSRKKRKVAIPKRLRGFVRTGGFYGAGSQELKFLDIATNDAVVVDDSWIIQNAGSVVNIVQGTTQSNRDGRKCVIKSLGWHFDIFTEAVAGGTTDPPDPVKVRVILYLDKQCNGATAANTDLIIANTDTKTFNNLANSGRFRTLMDRTYVLKSTAGGGLSTSNADFTGDAISDSFYKKCNVPLEFSGTTGAITEIRSNNIGWMICQNLSATGGGSRPAVRFAGVMRIRWVG